MCYWIRNALITITAGMLLGSGAALAASNACKADLTADGVVNFADLAVLKSVFFQRCNDPGPTCGDGIAQGPTEQCDDGNVLDGDGCSSTCSIEVPLPVVCGNGIAQGPTEQCDDGNVGDGDGCSATCTIEGPLPSVCGDGLAVTPEQCDGADFGGQDCLSLGHTGGELGCAADCTIDSSGCSDLLWCQFSVAGLNGCLDVTDASHCTLGGLSPVSGGTATLAPGLVCDGASGVCGSWTGPGTCCQLDDATRGIHTCVSSNDPTGSNCNLLEIFQPTSFSATPHFGETCVKEPARNGYMCQGLP